jgi:hypothetical protein
MSETRKVYRYENERGIGPYQPGWVAFDDIQEDHSNPTHPAWDPGSFERLLLQLSDGVEANNFFEVGFMPPSKYLSGTDSREALSAWFDGWTDTLERNGFRVVEYEVPAENVMDAPSGLQVAFKP